MNFLDLFKAELEAQERLAPRSENITRKNHYISQFFQKGWGRNNRGYALFAGDREIKSVNFNNTMMENYLYTVPQMGNPNIFEKRRSIIEGELASKLLNVDIDSISLTPKECSQLIALILCSSPNMLSMYRRAVSSYSSESTMSDWEIKAMGSMFMLSSMDRAIAWLLRDYNFRLVKTFEPMILSDYPAIQLINGHLINSLVGIYPKSDQIILPLNPFVYLEASKRSPTRLMLSNLRGSSVNDLMVRSSQRLVIGDSELSIKVALTNIDPELKYETALPHEIPVWVMETGAIAMIVRSGNSVSIQPIKGYSKVIPQIYLDSGFITDEDFSGREYHRDQNIF